MRCGLEALMAAANLYSTRAKVARRLPPGSLGSSAGTAAYSAAATDEFTCDGHGLETDDPVQVRPLGDDALPSPLVVGTTYYAIRTSNAAFKLAETVSGAPIDLTTDAYNVVVSRDPDFDTAIEFYSRWADSFFPAHLLPLQEPIHPLVAGIVTDLAAKRLLDITGQSSEILNAAEIAAKAQLERFVAGMPLRGAPATGPANLAIVSTLGRATDPRGWGSGTLP